MHIVDHDHLAKWNEMWGLAVVFGLTSVVWTYAFVAELGIPLWPAFIASSTYFATEGDLVGLRRGIASNLVGIAYGAATVAVVDAVFGGSIVGLSLLVGVFMFIASLHAAVPLLSFTPGGFFGYATFFGVHSAEVAAFGIEGILGETVAAAVSMLLGALIGFGADGLGSSIG